MVTVAGLEARRRDPKQRHWPHIKLSNLAGGGKGNAGKSSGFIGVGLGLGLEIPVKTGIRFGSRGGVLLGAETRKEKALRDGSRMAAREGVGPGCQQQKGGRGQRAGLRKKWAGVGQNQVGRVLVCLFFFSFFFYLQTI